MLPFSYATRNLFREPGKLVQKLIGSGLTVFLLLAAGMFNEGMSRMLTSTGNPQNVLFVGAGSEESVERSQIPLHSESVIHAGVVGIESRAGVAAVSGEVHFMGTIHTNDGLEHQALLRGVTPSAFEVHREVRLLEGRLPGSGEVLIGNRAARFLGADPHQLEIGDSITFEEEPFRIVGRIDAQGTVIESEFWMNRNDLMTLTQRETLSCVVVKLEDPAGFAAADLFTKRRLDLELSAIRETQYYAGMEAFYAPIRFVAWMTAVLVGAGAVFGALNLLYASFASRIREIATLQTLGYGRAAVLLSLLQESLLTQVFGALTASFASLWLLDGRMMAFSSGTFQMELSGSILLLGFAAALLMGTVGTLPPALRCLSAPLPGALRSS